MSEPAEAAGTLPDTPPFTLHEKMLPDGQQDDGEYLAIDTDKLLATTTTTTVSIFVH
jgi:hypothetical protein